MNGDPTFNCTADIPDFNGPVSGGRLIKTGRRRAPSVGRRQRQQLRRRLDRQPGLAGGRQQPRLGHGRHRRQSRRRRGREQAHHAANWPDHQPAQQHLGPGHGRHELCDLRCAERIVAQPRPHARRGGHFRRRQQLHRQPRHERPLRRRRGRHWYLGGVAWNDTNYRADAFAPARATPTASAAAAATCRSTATTPRRTRASPARMPTISSPARPRSTIGMPAHNLRYEFGVDRGHRRHARLHGGHADPPRHDPAPGQPGRRHRRHLRRRHRQHRHLRHLGAPHRRHADQRLRRQRQRRHHAPRRAHPLEQRRIERRHEQGHGGRPLGRHRRGPPQRGPVRRHRPERAPTTSSTKSSVRSPSSAARNCASTATAQATSRTYLTMAQPDPHAAAAR